MSMNIGRIHAAVFIVLWGGSISHPTTAADTDAPIIPSWIYSGAPLRIHMIAADSGGEIPCRRGTRIEGRFVASSPDSLWLDASEPKHADSWSGPKRPPSVDSEPLTILRADIQSIRAFRSGWGWIPTTGTPEDLQKSNDDLKIRTLDGATFRAKVTRVDADTLFVVGTLDKPLSVDPGLRATRIFSRDDLCRVDMKTGSHSRTGTGALVGLVGGVTLGALATAVIGEAETDGALPVWGIIVGPFVGAIVGKCISVDEWSPVWPNP